MVWQWFCGAMVFFALCLECGAVPLLRLETSLAPPYQELQGTQLTGESVETVQCVLNRLNHAYRVDIVPWKRAQNNLQNGLSDGFFSAIPQAQLDKVAILSAPIVLEKWFWFSLDPALPQAADFPPDLKIGVLRGSNQEQWLQDKGIHITQSVNQLSSLLRLLQIGRIDTFLADEHVMSKLLTDKSSQVILQRRFERYAPMGIYFSLGFLASHPDFIHQFNQQIPSCAVTTMHVTSDEERQLRVMVDQAVMPLLKNDKLRAFLRFSNRQHQVLDMDRIQQLDEIWKAASDEKIAVPEWIPALLATPESQLLKQWQNRQQGVFNEVLLTDSRGLLVAGSEMTSDYWQGDEEKVIRPLHMASTTPTEYLYGWFDQGDGKNSTALIEYDDSTRQFLVHVSYLIRDKQGVTGILCLGINLEIALKTLH